MMSRSSLLLLAGVAAALLFSTEPAAACKFRLIWRKPIRLDRTPNPVAVLMYANPSSESARETASEKLGYVLTKIGHEVKRVETEQELEKVLRTGRWDCETHGHHDVQVVVADLPDADQLRGSGLMILPIVPERLKFDARTRRRYPVVLTPTARASSHVPAIESAARIAVLNKARITPPAPTQRSIIAVKTPRRPIARGPNEARASGPGREPVAAGR